MTTALTQTQPNAADHYRQSTDAAHVCKAIVLKTAMEIQGRKYVKVEGWQAIAIAHGCTGSARDVENVPGGVRAIGEVRRMSDGAVIAEAEGFVGEDEPTWFGGHSRGKTLPRRADYAIRAMAQTRAISRACRSAFAHVVVLMDAGLSTTPAEEVPLEGFDDRPMRNVSPPRGSASPRTAKPGPEHEASRPVEAATIDVPADFVGTAYRRISEADTLAELQAWGAAWTAVINALEPEEREAITETYKARAADLKRAPVAA